MTDKKYKKIRIDELLASLQHTEGLKEARALVMAGKVIVNEQRVDKPSQLVDINSTIRIKGRKSFVSRGGEKLASAVEFFQLKNAFIDKAVLDIGASTGGFTDCALQLGAKNVVALDVGSNQLAWSLRKNPQVVCLENTDIRSFDAQKHPSFAWVLADISFNKLAKLAPYIAKTGSAATHFLLLVKPQFELARSQVPEGGVVANAARRDEALKTAIAALTQAGLKHLGSFNSQVKGRAGNQEIFILLRQETPDQLEH